MSSKGTISYNLEPNRCVNFENLVYQFMYLDESQVNKMNWDFVTEIHIIGDHYLDNQYDIDSRYRGFYINREGVLINICDSTTRNFSYLDKATSNLTLINIKFTDIEDLDLSKFENLEILNIAYNQNLRSLTGMESVELIRSIDVSFTQIKELPNLGRYFYLSTLSARYTPISSIEIDDMLPKLRFLQLSGSGLTEFNVYKMLPNINLLSLNNTSISSIKGIRYLQNIERLNLSETNISDISELRLLHNLLTLNLKDSDVESVYDFRLNRHIRKIILDGTLIRELPESLFINESLNIISLKRLNLERIDESIIDSYLDIHFNEKEMEYCLKTLI